MNSNHTYIRIDSFPDIDGPHEHPVALDFESTLRTFPNVVEHESIITQLLQMQFSLRAAMLCAQITGSNDLDHVLQFITSDENGFYNHPFLDEGTTKTCIICSDTRDKHVDALDPHQFENAQCISIFFKQKS